MPAEPTLAALPSPLARYLLATRPAFLSVTLFGCLVGLAGALWSGVAIDPPAALATVIFAMVAHAGINVLNDYYDALNGSDAANTDRIFPFTGGSRFIQNGVLSLRSTAAFGYALLAAVIPAGLWLTAHSAAGLILIGMAGLAVGWAYSAPPFKLMSRGLGEIAVTAGWLLVVTGADFVQRGEFSFTPLAAGLGYALLVANVLFINQFPDLKADRQAGKLTLVVRLGFARARWGYAVIAGLAHAWLVLMVVRGALPAPCLLASASALPSLKAARVLWRHAQEPSRLVPGITATIAAANLHGILLAVALCAAALAS
ncbi:MAG: hypothetical protein OHK0026_10120 [Rhodocyclaceae bacterium]